MLDRNHEYALARLKLQMDNMNQNLQEYIFSEPKKEDTYKAVMLREQIEERLRMLDEQP